MRAVAIVIVLASVALALVATAFAWLNLGTSSPVEKSLGGSKAVEVVFPLGVLAVAVTGGLIASRITNPHRIGPVRNVWRTTSHRRAS
jgi:hypothetical protein